MMVDNWSVVDHHERRVIRRKKTQQELRAEVKERRTKERDNKRSKTKKTLRKTAKKSVLKCSECSDDLIKWCRRWLWKEDWLRWMCSMVSSKMYNLKKYVVFRSSTIRLYLPVLFSIILNKRDYSDIYYWFYFRP